MKKALIGGFLTLVGSVWCLAALLTTGANVDAVASWSNPPGRFFTAMNQCAMTPVAMVGGLLLLCGLVIMAIEYFRKEG